MCGYQLKDVLELPATCSLTIPIGKLDDVQTIFISCTEVESLPKVQELDRLEPVAFLKVPGGLVGDNTSEHGKLDEQSSLLRSVLSNCNAEHIVLCLHTGCTYLSYTPECNDITGRLGLTHRPSLSPCVEFSLKPLQDCLLQQGRFVESLVEEARRAGRRLSIHCWLFEPEINWISFYDFETGLLLPLNAHSELRI